MKKILILITFIQTIFLSYSQWTQFSTGNVREISCASADLLVGIGGTATNNGLYKYNFTNNSWEPRSVQTGVYFNTVSIGTDGTIWATGVQGGGGMIRKFSLGNGVGTTQASSMKYIDVLSNSVSVGSIGTGLNNVQRSDASNAFATLSGLGVSAYKVSIGDDGTIYALANPTLVANNIFMYNGATWVNIPGNLYEIAVADANKVIGLDGLGVLYCRTENQWVNVLNAPSNIQKVTISNDGQVYVVTNSAGANIYKNTWESVSCRPAAPSNITSAVNMSICTGTSTVLTVNSNAIVEWYDGATLVGTGLSFTTPILTANKSYEARAINGTCSNSRSITVSVVPTPSLTLTTPIANLTICAGNTTTLTASGASLFWYDSETAVNYVGFNGTFTTPNLTGNTTFWVQAGSGGCLTPRTAVDVVVLNNPGPPTNTSNLGTVCPGPVTLTVESNFTVEWFTTSTSTTVLGTGLNYTIPNAVNGSIVYAQAVNGNCRSTRVAFPISAFPGESNYTNPVNTTLAENLVVCNGGTTTLSATGQGIMQWSDAFSGGNILGTGNTFITGSITQNTNIYYYALDGNCRSNIQYLTVSTTTSTHTTPTQNLSVCSGNTTTLTGVGTNNPVSWFEDATSLSPLFTGNSFVTPNLTNNTTYYLGHNHPSCVAERIPVTVNVLATPAAPTNMSSTTEQNICSGNGTQLTMDLVGTISWFTTESGGSIISTDNPLIIGTLITPSTLNYYAQANNGICSSSRTLAQIIVSENPVNPINSSSNAALNICDGNQTQLSVSSPSYVVWFDAPSGGNQLGTGLTFLTGILNSNQTFYAESQALPAACISAVRTAIQVNVTANPAAPQNLLGQNTICSGNSATLEASGTGTINWYATESSLFPISSGATFITPIQSLNTSYFAEVESNSCFSSRTEFAIQVNPTFQVSINETACDSFLYAGVVYTESDIYIRNFTSINGCDSIVTLNLTINNSSTSTFIESACGSYELNGQTYTNSGIYTQTFINSVGCDSILTLNLTIYQANNAVITETACLNFTLNGQTYSTDGTYIQNLTTVNGCDSTLTLNLTISTFATSTLNEIACESFTLNNEVYTSSGVYNQTLTSSQSCDSIITLNLTVNYPSSSTLTATACDSYVLNGQNYTASGVYVQTMQTVNGCDSTITLNLTINQSSSSSLNVVACNSYDVNGQIYTQSGTFIQVIPNTVNCDSTITLNLTINQSSSSSLTEVACGTFSLNNEIYTQSGTFTQVIQNSVACDSTITLNLTIIPNSSFSFAETACDSFTWNTETYLSSGVYQQTFTNSLGCDSIVTLDLTINNSSVLNLIEVSCSTYELNGITYTSSGTYVQNLFTTSGCDSTINLTLTINGQSSSILNETACGSFTLNNEIFTQSGIFTQVIQNSVGCDSTITLNLTISPISSFSFSENACDFFVWNSETFTQTGIYQQVFSNSQSCDSIVTLNLTINNSSDLDLIEITCSSFELNGEIYSETGIYIQNLTTNSGCDSTITLNLTVNSVDNTVTQLNETLTSNQQNASYQWIDCTNGNVIIDGATNQSFIASSNGEYSVQVILNSCTEISDCFLVNTLNVNEIKNDKIFSFYPNPSSNYVKIETSEINSNLLIMDIAGKIVLQEKLLSNETNLNIEHLADGVYHLMLIKNNGKSEIQKLVISKN